MFVSRTFSLLFLFLVLGVLVLAGPNQVRNDVEVRENCWDPTTPEECERDKFPEYVALLGQYVHCEPVPEDEHCHINKVASAECHNLVMTTEISPPEPGEGFKLSTHTNDNFCRSIIPAALGLGFYEYANCTWVQIVEQKNSIRFDSSGDWTVVDASYYQDFACGYQAKTV